MFKQLTIIILLPFLAVIGARSQDGSGISVGAKIGLNQNQFTMPGTVIGFNAGAFGSYPVSSFLDAKLEILYSEEGGGRQNYSRDLNNPSFGLPDLSGNIAQLNYINPYVYMHNLQVPLLAEFTLPEFREESVVPKLIIGGAYSYMFGATEMRTTQFVFKDGTISDIPYTRQNVGGNYNHNQWSLLAGFGLEFKGENRSFNVDLRYRQGLTQLNNVKQSFSAVDGRLYSSTISINFSMTIHKF